MTDPSVLAMVMAGGAGSRMAPLTDHRAKPAVPYAGVYRLIDFPLSNCAHSAITDVWVLQQFEPHALGEHLAGGRPWDLDRTRGGLQVLFPHQGDDEGGWHQGNADAIYRNSSVMRDLGPDIVVVLSADHVYKLDYRDVVATHLERAAELTLVTTVVGPEEVSRFGNVEVDGDGRVRDFRYKPDQPLSDVVTTEVFVFDARRLLDALDELAEDGGGGDEGLEDFGDQLLPYFVQRGSTWEHRFHEYWRDVGTPESYWTSHMDLLEPEPPLRLDDPAWPILTTAVARPPARLFDSASIDNSMISPACIVRGRVQRSVLAPGVVVEEGAEVYDSILLHDTVVASGALVAGVVADMGVRIGARASVGRRPEPGPRCSADDLVVLGEGTQVGPGDDVAPGSRRSD
ncbi:MAG TPA: glucose-1-phosphate adenylyltransferase family protein [Acidimicrobiales bacterium]|nr:glucose-1-phosphate adenylyltransferase family protein [Acidimicrobiales bacterium]